MCAALLIRDGNPWWASPDIWTVPGVDPNGPTAIPAVGEAGFVWARVENTSRIDFENITLNYYWSNPATGVLRSNSTMIGSAFASVPAGESREVLCLTPWVPAGVNGGHECLVVVAIHPQDPLPQPLPDPFDPPHFNQVAQRNIDLVRLASGMMRSLAIQIATPNRMKRIANLRVVRHDSPLDDALISHLGLKGVEFNPEPDLSVRLTTDTDMNCNDMDPNEELTLDIAPGTRTSVQLQLAAGQLSPGAYSWLSVVDAEGDDVFGGISFVVTGRRG